MLLHDVQELSEVTALPRMRYNARVFVTKAYLALSLPCLHVRKRTSATWVHGLASPDQHIIRWNDIYQWRRFGVVLRQPDRNRNVIRRASERDGQQAVNANQELCSSIIIC